MYAVFESGGKQYRVQEGDTILLDLHNWKEGDEVTFDSVVLLSGEEGTKVGTPLVEGVKILGRVLGEEKGKKIVIFKFKRRKKYRRKQGHRQKYHKVMIEKIEV